MKIEQAWKDLPSFLTIPTQDLWLRGRPCHEVDALHQIRLLYLNTRFLIEWAASRHGLDDTGSLFINASELLAWVNDALVRREQLSDLGMISLAWRVSSKFSEYWGVPIRAKIKYHLGRILCFAGCWCYCMVPLTVQTGFSIKTAQHRESFGTDSSHGRST